MDLNAARDDGVLGMQQHQLDHTQTICTSLEADNRGLTTPTPVKLSDEVLVWLYVWCEV